jgi:hypothetical protein
MPAVAFACARATPIVHNASCTLGTIVQLVHVGVRFGFCLTNKSISTHSVSDLEMRGLRKTGKVAALTGCGGTRRA